MGILRKKSGLAFFLALVGIWSLVSVPAVCALDFGVKGIRLSDTEMDHIRGGYAGFSFGFTFTGYWDNTGQIAGTLVANGNAGGSPPVNGPGGTTTQVNNTPVSETKAQLTNGNPVSMQAYLGNFNGARGIFQIVQSPGSYNVIHNNLTVQITILNVTSESALSAARGFLFH